MSLPINFPITPVPKPRMTQRDRWAQRPAVLRYFDFKDELRKQIRGTLDPRFTVTFIVPMPKSWNKQKRFLMARKPHQQKPDVDNYLKAFMDAVCEDDSYVYDARALKFWAEDGDKGSIILEERGQ